MRASGYRSCLFISRTDQNGNGLVGIPAPTQRDSELSYRHGDGAWQGGGVVYKGFLGDWREQRWEKGFEMR